MLNDCQCRVYDIITHHATLTGKKPKALRMILYREGRTEKSKVIQTLAVTALVSILAFFFEPQRCIDKPHSQKFNTCL
jgi:hypothetical protein